MKKEYIEPEMDIIFFNPEDIIVTSRTDNDTPDLSEDEVPIDFIIMG